jgi:hypothetical protein
VGIMRLFGCVALTTSTVLRFLLLCNKLSVHMHYRRSGLELKGGEVRRWRFKETSLNIWDLWLLDEMSFVA